MSAGTETTMAPTKPRGFAIPGYAAAAGRKGHALGVSPQFTPAKAREAVRKRGPLRRDASGRFQALAGETEQPKA